MNTTRRISLRRYRLAATLTAGLLAVLGCREDVTSPRAPETVAAEAALAQASNTWIARPSTPDSLEGSSVGAAPNAAGQWFVYVFGGDDGVTSGFAIQRYNVGTNTWARRSLINATAMNGVGRIGNRLYVTGGGRCCAPFSDAVFNTTLAYEPSTNQLFQKADMPRATTDGVTGVIANKLYVLAGFCSGEPSDPGHCIVGGVVRQFYRYDPVTDTWINRRQPPHFHRRGAGAVIDGKFYVVGGSSSTAFTRDLDVYDPVTNSWTTRAPIPTTGTQLSAEVIQNRMFVVSDSVNFNTGSEVIRAYSYDPATNIWKSRAPPPVFNQIARVQLNGQARLFLPGNRLSYLYAP